MPHMNIGERNLYYEIHGEGTEWITFLGGLTLGAASWPGQVKELSPHFRLLVLDLCGQGQSDKPEEDVYPLTRQAADLAKLLDKLGIEKTHLVGLSYGGVVSQYFVLENPQRVQRLVLTDTMCWTDNVFKSIARSWYEAQAVGGGLLRFRVGLPLVFGEKFLVSMLPAIPQMEQLAQTAPFYPLRALIEGVLVHDLRERLPTVKAPTLMMVGGEDRFTPVHHAELIAKLIPGAKLQIVPATGHSLPLEEPKTYNQAVLSFLKAQ